jgi:hypothetical protein
MKTQNATEPPSLVLQKMSRGHLRLMRKMGLALAEFDGETPEQIAAKIASLPKDQQEREGTAFLWLMTRDRGDVLPGGCVNAAVESGEWEKLVERWEFDLDETTARAVLAATRPTRAK